MRDRNKTRELIVWAQCIQSNLIEIGRSPHNGFGRGVLWASSENVALIVPQVEPTSS